MGPYGMFPKHLCLRQIAPLARRALYRRGTHKTIPTTSRSLLGHKIQPLSENLLRSSLGNRPYERPPFQHSLHSQKLASKAAISSSTEISNDAPAYTPPKTGLLSRLPTSWVPYGELMRVDKPAGLYLFYFPYLFGTLYGASLADSVIPASSFVAANAILLVGTIIMRGAACSWNDNIDRDFDRQVWRCRLRPIARGAIAPGQAHVFTGALSIVGLGSLALLPASCTYYSIPIILLLGLYPFAKRYLNYPQVVLGFPVSWAIFLGMAAVNVDPHLLISSSDPSLLAGMASFYISNIIWTIIYDTIYAHQDVKDDAKAGVKSIAVHWKGNSKRLLSGLAVVQVSLLVATGAFTGLGPLYYTISCAGAATSLAVMIRSVDLGKPSDCMWWFKNGAFFVGGSIAAGLFGEYVQKLLRSDSDEETGAES